jgi:hypothetical protein
MSAPFAAYYSGNAAAIRTMVVIALHSSTRRMRPSS